MALARRAFGLLFAGVLAAGCPQFLDDFETVPAGDASVGGAPDSSTGGVGGVVGGNGGTSGGGTGASGGTGGADASPCSSCASGETCCDDQCVNTETNGMHCGACGVGCPGTTCATGACTNTCLLGHLDCDQNAVTGCEVDAATDTENCGSCGATCSFDQTCETGKCVCPAGSGNCDNDLSNGCETNIATDANNCSACGKSCGPNQVCAASVCQCAAGFGDCNGDKNDGCEVDLKISAQNCSACGMGCGENGSCADSKCGCLDGFQNCDTTVGCETAVTDANNCGTCGTVCSGGTPVCNGSSCVSACAPSETKCGSSCVDTQTDPQHCGGCNQAVAANQSCVNGTPACLAGWGNCDGIASNGCELNVTSDDAHCGSCTNQCKPGAVCSASTCQCATATPNDCGSQCRVCCGDAQCADQNPCTTDTCTNGTCSHTNCAAGTVCCALGCFQCCDSTQCTGGKVCSNNQCVLPTCVLPEILCGTSCTNPNTDNANCGGCGKACGIARNCVAGVCTPPWAPVGTTNAPSARSHAAFVSMTGLARVFVWGGIGAAGAILDTGAIYDVATDAWLTVNKDANTPSPRVLATAVWTGDSIFVWGGGSIENGGTDYNNGAIYDPVAGTWTAVSTVGAPPGRRAARGVWTGSKVLIYGGINGTNAALTGTFLYDPVAKQWSTASSGSEPSQRSDPTIGWTGTDLYVFGGRKGSEFYNELYRFDAASAAWERLQDAPLVIRHGALGGWDGVMFVAWGGHTTGSTIFNDGARYSESSSNWSSTSSTNPPSVRYAQLRDHGWSLRISNGNMLLLGGFGIGGATMRDGAIYSSGTNKWEPVAVWGVEDHRFGVAAWADVELLLWGGRTAGLPTATGERFRP